jgi:hypothetical protein
MSWRDRLAGHDHGAPGDPNRAESASSLPARAIGANDTNGSQAFLPQPSPNGEELGPTLADDNTDVDAAPQPIAVCEGAVLAHAAVPAVLNDRDERDVLARDANSAESAISPPSEAIGNNGAVPSEWAERLARLDPNKPPADVPPVRWQQFIDDACRFLDDPFCAVAVALGWGSLDLFGCNRRRPYARIDQAGLVWSLNGRRLIALTAETAVIETESGARQTFYRKPVETGRVLAWKLGEPEQTDH